MVAKILEILKIYNGYRYHIGAVTGIFFIFLVVSKPVSEKNGTGKSLGTGIGKIWFGTIKSIGIGIVQHFGYRHTLVHMTSD